MEYILTDAQRKELIEYLMELEEKLAQAPINAEYWHLQKWQCERDRVMKILLYHD